jgi:hypothetical protein
MPLPIKPAGFYVMKIYLVICCCLLFAVLRAQNLPVLPVDTKGRMLDQFYHQLNVTTLWQAGRHVNAQTGKANNCTSPQDTGNHAALLTAAVCKKLHICFLQNTSPKQALTVNMMAGWLLSAQSQACYWQQITGDNAYITVQKYANKGYIVLAVYNGTDDTTAIGQAAFVKPYDMPLNQLNEWGPHLIMAGPHNAEGIQLKRVFTGGNVTFFYNTHLAELPNAQ